MKSLNLRHALLDNPILMKHWRSRLRRNQLLSPIIVVVALSLLIAWWGYVGMHFQNGGVARAAAAFQGIILAMVGASQVGVSLSTARESGILDFHRISPLRPAITTIGFFLGGPIREYLLALIPIPLLLISVALGGVSFLDALQWEVGLVLVAWVFHVAALLSALVSRRPMRNGIAVLIVIGVILFGNVFSWIARPRYFEEEGTRTMPFFGISLPWLLWLALYASPLIVFGLLAATRKMQSDRAHLLSKPQAIGFQAILTTLVIGGFVDPEPQAYYNPTGFYLVVVLYLLLLFGCLVSTVVVPTLGEYTRGLRRARREGRVHLNLWDDLALNRPTLAVLCGIILAGGSILFWRQSAQLSHPSHLSLAVALTVLTVAYVGLAHQWLALVVPNRATSLLALFLFLVCALPLLAGAVLGISNVEGLPRDILFGLSPVSAIAALAASAYDPFGRNGTPVSDALRLASLVPALGLPLLFNNLITSQRRKIDAAIHEGKLATSERSEIDLTSVEV